jgi:prevent-host-death family protein
MTKAIKASEFKAKCLALIDEVAESGTTLTITKNGKPVADVIPHQMPKRSPLGLLKGRMAIKGDIISPIDVDWEVLK